MGRAHANADRNVVAILLCARGPGANKTIPWLNLLRTNERSNRCPKASFIATMGYMYITKYQDVRLRDHQKTAPAMKNDPATGRRRRRGLFLFSPA